MRFLIDDRGIFNEYFSLLKKTFKKAGRAEDTESTYIMAYMCWGAGVYFASKQWTIGKTIDNFTNDEIDSMFTELSKNDAIGLAYDSLGILSGSYNYNVITKGIQSAFMVANDLKPAMLDLMQIFFNAGVTCAYERFER